MPKRLIALVSGLVLAAAPARAQTIEVTPEVARATVGDPVWLRLRIQLGEGDQILDSTPVPHEDLERGVRILATERLVRTSHRNLEGRIRMAFYRTGSRPVPTLEVPFRRGAAVLRAMMLSQPATVEITPVLPPGSPSLKDLKDLEPTPGSGLLPWVIAALAAAVGAFLLARRRRRAPPVPVPVQALPPPPPVPAMSPYDGALSRLAALERENWPAKGDVARHYETIVEVLREYLEEGERVSARERTTSELLPALPPHLTHGDMRERCRDLLGDADLVKFAKWRPSAGEAAAFLDDARGILDRWQAASRGATNGKAPSHAAAGTDRTVSDALR